MHRHLHFLEIGTHVSLFGVNYVLDEGLSNADFNENSATYNTGAGEGPVVFNLPGITADPGSPNSTGIANYPLFSSLPLPPNQYNLGIATKFNDQLLNPEPLSISYFIIETNSIETNSTGIMNSNDMTQTHPNTRKIVIIVLSITIPLMVILGIATQMWRSHRLHKKQQQDQIPQMVATAGSGSTPIDDTPVPTGYLGSTPIDDTPTPTDGTLTAENGVVNTNTAEASTWFSQARDFVMSGARFANVGGNMIEIHQPTIIMSPELDKVVEPA